MLAGVGPRTTRAGNDQSVLVGNQAALSGGVANSLSLDSGALWYNPAGLANLGTNTLDVSASAFVLRIRTMPGVLETRLYNHVVSEDIRSVEFLSIPSSLIFARRVHPKVVLGFGIVVPRQDAMETNIGFEKLDTDPQGAAVLVRQRVEFAVREVETHAGVGVGWQPIPRLRIGASLWVIYQQVDVRATFSRGIAVSGSPTDDGAGLLVSGSEIALKALNGRLDLGIQWDAGHGWHLGLTFRSPTVHFYRTGSARSVEAAAVVPATTPGAADLALAKEEPSETAFEMIRHLQVALGVTWRWAGGWVGAEADLEPALRNTELGVDRALVWNVRVGARFAVAQNVDVGVGVFTDNGASRRPEGIADADVDYYGLTAGVEIRSPHRLAAGGKAPKLVFSTTIAVRYAFGLGRVGAVSNDLANDTLVDLTRDVVFHEIGLHVGSTLYF